MNKKTTLPILLIVTLCLSWFAVAKWREGKPPVPGWKHRVGMDSELGRVEMWLPPEYENIDPQFMTFMFRSSVDEAGLPMEWLPEASEIQIVFAAQDTKQGGSGTRMIVTYSVFEPDSRQLENGPDEWIALAEKFPIGELLEGTKIQLGDRQLPRMVFKIRLDEQEAIVVQYIIRDGTVLWFPAFVPGEEDYESQLPVYDRIMQTFEIIGDKDY